MAPVFLRELLALPLLRDARVVAGHEGVRRRQIRWPVVLEWPAEDFARTDELVLTTALSCDAPMLLQMVTEMIDAGAAAMCVSFTPREGLEEVPDEVRELADEHEFPVIELPWRLRFADVSKAVINRVVERQLGDRPQRDALALGFTRVVVDGHGYDGIAHALEDLLYRPVLIFDADFCLRGSGPHARRDLPPERLATLASTDGLTPATVEKLRQVLNFRKAKAIDGVDELSLEPGIGLSAVVQHEIVGYVYALDVDAGEGLPTLELRALEHAAVAVAMESVRQRAALEAETRLRGHFVWSVALGAAEPAREIAAKAPLLGYDLRKPYQLALAVAGAPEVSTDDVEREIRRIAKELRLETMVAVRGSHLLLLVPGSDGAPLRQLVDRVHGALPDEGCVTWGLAGEARLLLDLRRSYQEATGALAVGRMVFDGRSVADPVELGPLLMLLPLGRDAEVRGMANDVLSGILEYDRATSRDLLGTLRVYLEENGNTSAAARRLFLNRHSLLYRLRKIEELTGRSLDSANDRFIFDLSLRLLQFRSLPDEDRAA